MRLAGPIAATAGGAVLAGLLAWWRASATRDGVLAASGGDPAKARAAGEHARAATTRDQVAAAAREAVSAAESAPPASGEAREAARAALGAADRAQSQWEIAEAAGMVSAAAEKVSKNATVKLRLTTYWPFTAKESEREMEGGVNGAAKWRGRKVVDPSTGKRVRLRTLEDHLAGKSDYFSLSGDPAAWPFGQLVLIRLEDGRVARGRVVDTGGNFRGKEKQYRVWGAEPVDGCVRFRTTKLPTTAVAEVVRGDHWDLKGETLVASAFRGQSVDVGWCPYCLDGYPEYCDALDGMGECKSSEVSSLHMLGASSTRSRES